MLNLQGQVFCLESGLLFLTELTLMTRYKSADLSLLCFQYAFMCCSSSETGPYPFLHCSIASFLSNEQFGIFGEPASLYSHKFRGIGSSKETKIPRKCSVFAVLQCLWLEWKRMPEFSRAPFLAYISFGIQLCFSLPMVFYSRHLQRGLQGLTCFMHVLVSQVLFVL